MTRNNIPRLSLALRGVLIFCLSLVVLSTLDGSGKWVLALGVPVFVAAWFRYLVHFLLIAALVSSRGELHLFRSQTLRFQILRGAVILCATISFFTALTYLPQAQATTLVFLAPLIVLALAPWVLAEPKRISRWIAAGVGFLGVLIVIRPGAGLDPVGVGFGLLTACLLAAQHLCTRKVAIDHPLTTMLWSGLVGALVLSIAMPWLWVGFEPVAPELSLWQWFVLISLGITGGLGHLLQIQAYRLAPASLLAPFMYLQIVAAATLGWLIWGDFPDQTSWLGIGLICASGAGIGWYEWYRARREKREQQNQSLPEEVKRPA